MKTISHSSQSITLRPYQEEALASIPEAGAFLICLATGLGKSVVFSRVPRRGRMLILSHRDELVHQPEKYFDCSFGVEQGTETSHGEEVVSASVQSLVRRLHKFKPDDFDVLVTDECFPAGTLIDGMPIEHIQVGDMVTAFNHKIGCLEQCKVLHVFKQLAPDKIIRINGELICTANHPIYDVKTGGYINAANLKLGDSVLLRMRRSNQLGQSDQTSALHVSQNGACLLFGGMFEGILPEHLIKDNEPDQQKICFNQDENSQSNEEYNFTCKNVSDASANGTQAQNTRGERARIDNSAGFINGTSCLFGASERIYCEDLCIKNQSRTLSVSLQDRHSDIQQNGSNRGGRNEPYCLKQKSSRYEERRVFEIQRVDSIEVLECRNSHGCNELCPDGYVYNLEVEGLNNYFANGILVHNCHHSTAPTYRKIYDYFKPRLHLGFTATPNRNDGLGLNSIYQDIIFERNLKWGIENHYLSDIHCLRVDIGVDLRHIAQRLGDYAPDELEHAINIESANKAIAKAYELYAKPPALIFCASVAHAEALADLIPGAVAVKGGEDRSEIVQAFSEGKIPCITNCMVFTEGTDLPNIQTVIMARPTKNISLYMQCVGRATRLYPNKEYALLIDCVGTGDDIDLCTAPSLLGLDLANVPASKRKELQGDLFDLPELIEKAEDSPEAWIRNVEFVDIWARNNNYDMHGVNYFRMPDGSLVLSEPKIILPPEDSLGRIKWNGQLEPAQKVFDVVYEDLRRNHKNKRALWDLNLTRQWGNSEATDKQKALIRKKLPEFDVSSLTKFEAAQILTRCFANSPSYEPPTSKQIYVLRSHGYEVEGLSKYDAMKIIGRLKGA